MDRSVNRSLLAPTLVFVIGSGLVALLWILNPNPYLIAYVIAGLLIVVAGSSPRVRWHPTYSVLLGALFLVGGVGTLYFERSTGLIGWTYTIAGVVFVLRGLLGKPVPQRFSFGERS